VGLRKVNSNWHESIFTPPHRWSKCKWVKNYLYLKLGLHPIFADFYPKVLLHAEGNNERRILRLAYSYPLSIRIIDLPRLLWSERIAGTKIILVSGICWDQSELGITPNNRSHQSIWKTVFTVYTSIFFWIRKNAIKESPGLCFYSTTTRIARIYRFVWFLIRFLANLCKFF